MSKQNGRLFQILWPSQNIWTLSVPKHFKHHSKIKILLSDWSAIQYWIDFLLTDMVMEVDFKTEVSLFYAIR